VANVLSAPTVTAPVEVIAIARKWYLVPGVKPPKAALIAAVLVVDPAEVRAVSCP
jgi:hypothetical protein